MNRVSFILPFSVLIFTDTGIPADQSPMSGDSPAVMGSQHALDEMDKRVPLPLLPHMANHQKQNMREHLSAVQGIIDGLSKDDFKAVSEAASKMGLSAEMEQMCKHMGAGAVGFTELAVRFHKTADEIAEAARKKNRKGIFDKLNATLAQCTGCHATYKQQVVDETTYRLLTEKPRL